MGNDKIIAEWLEEVKYQSAGFLKYVFLNNYDDSTGWGEILKEKMKKTPQEIQKGKGLLLVGPRGCGKHTAVYHVIKYLADTSQYAYKYSCEPFNIIYIGGEDFSFSENEQALIYDSLNTLLDDYCGKSLCLVIEYPELCKNKNELLKHLGRFSRMYNVEESFAPLLLIIITEDESVIPATLRERLDMCRMEVPSQRKRLIFFENMIALDSDLNDAFNDTLRGMDLNELVELTEGADYTQMNDILRQLSVFVKTGTYLIFDNMRQAVIELLPNKLRHISKDEFYDRMIELVDVLPNILSKNTVAVQSNSVSLEKNNDYSIKETIDENKITQETSKMTTYEIAVELYGEEKIKVLLNEN